VSIPRDDTKREPVELPTDRLKKPGPHADDGGYMKPWSIRTVVMRRGALAARPRAT
jgi:hypothetical protein